MDESPVRAHLERLPAPLAPRALSAMERGIWLADLGAPLNFTTTARVKGPLTEERVRAALPAVRARHAFLRARIVAGQAGEASFRFDSAAPLVLRVVRGGAGWVAEVEREINEPFVSDPGPLARFTLIELGAEEACLLVTLHHSVGDGLSGTYLMRDLVEAAAQACEGKTPELPVLPAAGSIDALVPRSSRGPRGWLHHARFAAFQLWVRLRHGRPIKLRRDQDLFAYARRSRVIPHQFDEEFTERLTARARAERTTVHGAMSAAMLLGLLADAGARRGCVAFGTPVNVRAQLAPAVGEQLGFYVSMVSFNGPVDGQAPFWDLARQLRNTLERDLKRGVALSMVDLMPTLFKLLGVSGLAPRALVERFERRVPTTTGLTNLGRLSIETRHGPLSITECHFAPSPSALGDFLATATSLHQRIFWNFVWPDPVLTQEHAEQLVGKIVERLRQAVAS